MHSWKRSGPSSSAVWANGDVARAAEHLGEVATADACRRSSGSGRWSAAARTRVVGLPEAVECDHTGVERGAGGEHLERRARHVALLVRVGEQRIAFVGLELGDVVERRVVVGVGDEVGVEARLAPHRDHGAGLDLDAARSSPRVGRAGTWRRACMSSRTVRRSSPELSLVGAEAGRRGRGSAG